MIFDSIIKDSNIQSFREDNIIKLDNMCIFINPSPNRNYGRHAYFKVSNNLDPRIATKEIRLHFYDIGYEVHKGKKLWILNKSEKDKLMKLLLSRPTAKKYKMYENTWIALIAAFNDIVQEKDKLPLNLPIPDYTKI